MLAKLIVIEHKKNKKSFAFWLTVFGIMLVPFVVCMVMLLKPAVFVPPPGVNPWKPLMVNNITSMSSFLFPMYIIYLVGLLGNIEYKTGNWKKLFVLPIKKEMLLLSKFSYLLLNVFFGILLLIAYTFIFALISGAVHPELKLFDYSPDFELLVWLVYHLFLSVIGIIGVQFLLSMFIENILVTLAIGLFLIVGSLIAAGYQWDYIDLVPYAAPHLFAKDALKISDWLTPYEISNLIFMVLCFFVCLFFLKRKAIK